MKPKFLSESERRRNDVLPSPGPTGDEAFTNVSRPYERAEPPRSSAATTSTYFGRKFGVSTAFSKHSSTATFFPKFGKHRSKNQTTLDYINAEVEDQIPRKNMDSIKLEGGDKKVPVDTRSNRAFYFFLIGFLVVGALVGFSTGYFIQEDSKAEEAEESDFCSGGDQNARDVIAAEFDDSFAGQSLDFTGKNIECVPDDAFAALNEDQKSKLSTVTIIRFVTNALEKIGNKALIAPELEQVTQLDIEDNGVSDLGDEFLESLPNLETVILSGNAFLRLDSDVFRKSSTETLIMNFNPLLEIPNAIVDSQIQTVSLRNCAGMVKFEPQMFENTTISSIDLSLTGLGSLLTEAEVASSLGVNQTVLVGFS